MSKKEDNLDDLDNESQSTRKSNRSRVRSRKAIENDIMETRFSLETSVDEINSTLSKYVNIDNLSTEALESIRDELEENIEEFDESWHRLKQFLDEGKESLTKDDNALFKEGSIASRKCLRKIIRQINGEVSNSFDSTNKSRLKESIKDNDSASNSKSCRKSDKNGKSVKSRSSKNLSCSDKSEKSVDETRLRLLAEAAAEAEKVKSIEKKYELQAQRNKLDHQIELEDALLKQRIAEKQAEVYSNVGSSCSHKSSNRSKSNISNVKSKHDENEDVKNIKFEKSPTLQPESKSKLNPNSTVFVQRNYSINSPIVENYSSENNAFTPTMHMPSTDSQIAAVLAAAMQQFCNQQIAQNEMMLKIQEEQVLSSTRAAIAKAEPPIFSGEIIKYPAWKCAFKALIDSKPIHDNEKLFLLGKYTSGRAKTMIDTHISLGTGQAYTQAIDLLEERYGNPTYIYEAFREKLSTWPKVNKGSELQDYYDFIQQLYDSMEGVDNLKMFDHISSIKEMVRKLPSYTFNEWQKIYESTIDAGNVLTLEIFLKFLRKISKRAVDPIFSREALTSTKETSKVKETKKDYVSYGAVAEDKPKFSCLFCKKSGHEISRCDDMSKLTFEKIEEFFKAENLCYGCGVSGHFSNKCTNRKKCKLCEMKHLTICHNKKKDASKDSNSTDSKEDASAVSSSVNANHKNDQVALQPIVLVKVHHKDNPGKFFKTYALIDGGSNVCFVTKNLVDKLQVRGTSTHLKLNTVNGTLIEETCVVNNLICKGVCEDREVEMPAVYVKDELPMAKSSIPTIDNVKQFAHLADIADSIPPLLNEEIGLIIGTNCSKGTFVEEIRSGGENLPQGFKYILGWTVQGPTGELLPNNKLVSNRIIAEVVGDVEKKKEFIIPIEGKEIFNPYDVARLLDVEYKDLEKSGKSASIEDKRFIEIVTKSIHKTDDGHFEMVLPLRKNVTMPNNRGYVYHRFISILNKLRKDPVYHEKYTQFMQDMFQEGHAEIVPKDELSKKNEESQRLWYIPHFGVMHPRKPEKTRVVFDCAAKYQHISLNDQLLQGPDLTSSLLGVLLRFRVDQVAFMADIKSMFHQVKVNKEDRDFLRFFWVPNGELNSKPVEYRMAVHLFGAVSSPSCSNFALRKCTDESIIGLHYPEVARKAILKNMYVDDLLKSVKDVDTAKKVIEDIIKICKAGGFELSKFHFNSPEVAEAICADIQVPSDEKVMLEEHSEKHIERALGIHWSIKEDTFGFCITSKDCSATRRGILSLISSVYDPLGFCSPVILIGKRVLQSICKLSPNKLQWDDPVPEKELAVWEKWKNELFKLNHVIVKRCYIPKNFGKVVNVQMHHFCDAAPGLGLGQSSYLRITDVNGSIHCSLLLAKSRVPPIKAVTVPRLELNACVQLVRIAQTLNKELVGEFEENEIENFYWTDSMIALGYILNESSRFKIFVANRVDEIRSFSMPEQWHHVRTKENPADLCSRGCNVDKLLKSNFYHGPSFLWNDTEFSSYINPATTIEENDPELKNTFVCQAEINNVLNSLEKKSSWEMIRRIMAWILRWRYTIRTTEVKSRVCNNASLSVEELVAAEKKVFWLIQQRYLFMKEDATCSLDASKNLKVKVKSLAKLDPFLDSDGLLRVGGRLKNCGLPFEIKHPVLLPKGNDIVKSIVLFYHEKVFHQGRGITANEIRQHGIWIFGGSKYIANIVNQCFICRKLRSSTSTQKMADLPMDRVSESPCFSYVGCDFFGPFMIKERRSQLKRYGCLFTCLVSRAIHIEVSTSLDTSSFINCLRRFLCRRGPVRHIRCDQGTNFIGGSNELRVSIENLDNSAIKEHLLKGNCDWVVFKFNSPASSHMGGVWERQIRTVRTVLNGLLLNNGPLLDHDGLLTLMCEVEAVINSRPLTTDDSSAMEPLTPNHLLTAKTKVVLAPPGEFVPADQYTRKRWRHVQYLVNQFWSRYRSEYMLELQQRQKWTKMERNYQVGDIVLIKEAELPRNTWKLAKVIETFNDEQGTVRKVKVKCANANLDKNGVPTAEPSILERPIHKLVLLIGETA